MLERRPSHCRLVDHPGSFRNRESETRATERGVRGEARDHDVPLQTVRGLDIELPDARISVVDPDPGIREIRVGALRDECYRVSLPTADRRGARGSDIEARARRIQKLLGRIDRAGIASGVRHLHHLTRDATREVNPECGSVGGNAISAVESDTQQIGLLPKNHSARRLGVPGQRISEGLSEFSAHAVQAIVRRSRPIDDRVGTLRARGNREHGKRDCREIGELFHM